MLLQTLLPFLYGSGKKEKRKLETNFAIIMK